MIDGFYSSQKKLKTRHFDNFAHLFVRASTPNEQVCKFVRSDVNGDEGAFFSDMMSKIASSNF